MNDSYPINVEPCVLSEYFREIHENITETAKDGKWEELIESIHANRLHSELVNCSKLREKNVQPDLCTPLHYAAYGCAPKDVFEKLISMGAAKCLKTAQGLTAYDIAKEKGLAADIIEVLEVPEIIQQNAAKIEKMEKGLHSVINGRVSNFIEKNGQSLPQLAYLYEKKTFYYPIPGWYGGFSVYTCKDKDGIMVDSWSRVCGGSEENHFIDTNGNAELLKNEYPI